MSTEHELLRIEHELAAGSGSEYMQYLLDDAIVIVPGQALDKPETVGAMDQSPGWTDFTITETRILVLSPEAALLNYRFDGRRDGKPAYAALMTSIYRNTAGGWKLGLHQQTPIAPS